MRWDISDACVEYEVKLRAPMSRLTLETLPSSVDRAPAVESCAGARYGISVDW